MSKQQRLEDEKLCRVPLVSAKNGKYVEALLQEQGHPIHASMDVVYLGAIPTWRPDDPDHVIMPCRRPYWYGERARYSMVRNGQRYGPAPQNIPPPTGWAEPQRGGKEPTERPCTLHQRFLRESLKPRFHHSTQLNST